MATLIKANNTTALTLSGSWSPAQAPTASDSLVFNTTYAVATGTSLLLGGTLSSVSLSLGSLTGGSSATTMIIGSSSYSSTSLYPWSSPSFSLLGTNVNWNLQGGLSSSTSALSLTLAPGYRLTATPANSNVSVSFPLTSGVPAIALLAPGSSSDTVNYSMIENTVITVGATDNALIANMGYGNSGSQLSSLCKVIVTGHPTLPTAITFNSPGTATSSTASQQGFNGAVKSMVEGNDGNLYFAGSFGGAGYPLSATVSSICGYDPITQRVIPIWLGSGPANAAAKDSSGNIYFGYSASMSSFSSAVTSNGIIRYSPTTNLLTPLQTGLASGSVVNAININAAGLVYVAGSFSATGNALSVANVATYDPGTNTWSALGTGTNAAIAAATLDPSGNLYVAGSFTTAGGGAAAQVAKWDPVALSWSALGAGPGQAAIAIAHDSTNNAVYVGVSNLYGGGSQTAAVPSDGTTTTLSQPNATITSPNYPSDYPNSSNGFVRANALGVGTYYTVTGSYNVESGYDYVRILDGVGNVLATYTGTGTINFTSSNNQTIQIRFTSDSGVTASGFSLALTAYSGSTPANPVKKYDIASSTWSNLTGLPSASCTSLAWDNTNNKLYAGLSAGSRYYVWDAGTATWSVIGGGGNSGTPSMTYIDSTGKVWWGSSSTAMGLSGVTSSGIAKWDPVGLTWSNLPMATQAVFVATSFDVFSGSNFTSTPLFSHGQGYKTYVVTPNTTVCIRCNVLTYNGASITVRRGGALLELPSYTAQSGTNTFNFGTVPLRFSGTDIRLDAAGLTNAATYVGNLYGNSTKLLTGSLSIAQNASSVTRYVLMNTASSTDLTLGNSAGATYYLGELDNTSLRTSYAFNRISSSTTLLGYYLTPSSPNNWMTPALPFGAPGRLSNINLSSLVNISSSYIKIDNSVTIDPALSLGAFGGSSPINVSSNCIVDWNSTSDIMLNGALAEIRVNSFSNLNYLGTAKYIYTGAGPLTLSQPFMKFSARFIAEKNSGAVTVTSNYGAYYSSTGGQSGLLYFYNSADNVIQTSMASMNRTTPVMYIGGTGTVRLTRSLCNNLQTLLGGVNLVLDFSDPGAPLTDLIQRRPSSSDYIFQSGNGRLTLKGASGADNSQFIPNITLWTSGDTTTATGDSYIDFNLNGASSLVLQVNYLQTDDYGLRFTYVSGLSASARLEILGFIYSSTSFAPGLVLTGPNGAGDFAYKINNYPLSPVPDLGLTVFPQSGSLSTVTKLTGSQAQTGNTSVYGVKVIPTSGSDSIDLASYTLTSNYQMPFLLTGNNGGTYQILGNAAARMRAAICNVSNTELQLLSPMSAAPNNSGYSMMCTSGSGVISFGTPTQTYVNAVTTAFLAVQGVETRIYAGTDNVVPYINSEDGTGSPPICVGGGSTLRLLGAGTGRSLTTPIGLGLNSTLQVDESWAIPAVVPSPRATNLSSLDWRMNVNVAATKTLTVSYWELANIYTSSLTPYWYSVNFASRYVKKGAGTLRYLQLPTNTNGLYPLLRIEEGMLEFALTIVPAGRMLNPFPTELLSGASILFNSTLDHDFNFVVFGAGSVTKSNTNTVRVRAKHQYTGGLTITTGEYDAQYRCAVGNGDVTVSGGTLRASAVDEVQYVLEIAGKLILSGGAIAIGSNYVA